MIHEKKIIAAGESDVAKSLGIGLMTLSDIVGELEKPGRDIRDSLPPPVLRRGALDISELKNGDELDGTVRNVTDFGAFIDIGVHHDGLLHVSKYRGDKPKVGQNLKVRVISVEPERGRIGLERA
ncbi:MAG: S1 RNA-binding domain-containing protein [Clostridia bacterium]|nr:S1 RNA-binding domain-containing protein [Clostridia bacterium]